MKKSLSILFLTCALSSFGQIDTNAVNNTTNKIDSTKSSATTIGGGLDFNYAKAEKYILGPIRIEGADNFDPQAIKLIAGLKQGESITIPSDRISNAIKNLWNEGLFSHIAIEAEKEVAGVIYLVIKLTPRPKLSRFRFTGVSKREVDKIREEIDLSSGQTITENLLFKTKNKIRGYFLEKGFNNAQITITQVQDTLINNSEIFFIDIDKGKKVKIKRITFDGATAVRPWKLRKVMKDTKRRSIMRVFKRSKFNQTAYIRDKEAVLDKFRGVGLRDVQFTVDSVYKINSRNIGIYLKVDEGQKYYFGDISWIGNTKFSSGVLDTVLGIKYGDVYDIEQND